MRTVPELSWLNRQRTVSSRQLRLPVVRQVVERAWPEIVAAERRDSVLTKQPEIFFVLVSDAKICALHEEFMNEPSPTDVITFQHGEIVISAETAKREARQRSLSLPEEIVPPPPCAPFRRKFCAAPFADCANFGHAPARAHLRSSGRNRRVVAPCRIMPAFA